MTRPPHPYTHTHTKETGMNITHIGNRKAFKNSLHYKSVFFVNKAWSFGVAERNDEDNGFLG